jgi:cytoskeletal protein CcmA (bactofilin family)
MALWKDPAKPSLSDPSDISDKPNPARFDTPDLDDPPLPAHNLVPDAAPATAAIQSASESHIAPDLVIEGKIEGAGHVRIAGRFKGDINVRGDLTIEEGAKVDGSVKADRVTVAGELVGNIETATHIELLQTGALNGDVKSTTFSVAKGSKMRGQAEFGWDNVRPGVAKFHKSGTGHGGSGDSKE